MVVSFLRLKLLLLQHQHLPLAPMIEENQSLTLPQAPLFLQHLPQAPEANPLASRFRDPIDSNCSTYYTEGHTKSTSVRPSIDGIRPLQLRELVIQQQQQHTDFVSWQKKQTGYLLTEINLLHNYVWLNRFYTNELMKRMYGALLQHTTENELNTKGIMRTYPWMETRGD